MAGMRERGLAKLVEELGELQQVAGKMIQYPELQMNDAANHPSRYNLRRKMEEELGDVAAAIEFVIKKLDLSPREITIRHDMKLARYEKWDREES